MIYKWRIYIESFCRPMNPNLNYLKTENRNIWCKKDAYSHKHIISMVKNGGGTLIFGPQLRVGASQSPVICALDYNLNHSDQKVQRQRFTRMWNKVTNRFPHHFDQIHTICTFLSRKAIISNLLILELERTALRIKKCPIDVFARQFCPRTHEVSKKKKQKRRSRKNKGG